MRAWIGFLALWVSVASIGAADAQVIPPLPVGGPAQRALQQLYPPTPLEQVRQQSLRQSPPLPPPAPPTERWIPERQVLAPDLGRVVIVPGHYERRISDQLYAVPTLRVYEGTSGAMIIVPGGDRPPVDVRTGP